MRSERRYACRDSTWTKWFAFLCAIAVLGVTPAAWSQSSGGRYGGSTGFGSSSSSAGGGSERSPSGRAPVGSSYGGGSGGSHGSGSAYEPGSNSSENNTTSDSVRSPDLQLPPDIGASRHRTTSPPPASGESPEWLGPLLVAALFAAFVTLVVLVAWRSIGSRRSVNDDLAAIPSVRRPCEVRRISIAFDWTARSELQAALEKEAARFDMKATEGLWQSAGHARDLLVSHLDAARYGCFQNVAIEKHQAQSEFERTCADLARRYGKATIANAQRARLDGEIVARREEGEGLVVVSIVVGTMVPLASLPSWPTRESVRKVLSLLLPAIPTDLAAVEVTWSPSVDADRMSSAELEVLYPELVPLDGTAGVGRVVCAHCRCVYALELKRCPACGSGESTPSPADVARAFGAPVTSHTTMKCKFCSEPMPVYEVQCQQCGARTDGAPVTAAR